MQDFFHYLTEFTPHPIENNDEPYAAMTFEEIRNYTKAVFSHYKASPTEYNKGAFDAMKQVLSIIGHR